MAQYRVTETQHICYTWFVDADSEEEAIESADGGVPENAREELIDSEVEAVLEVSPSQPTSYALASPAARAQLEYLDAVLPPRTHEGGAS